MNSHESDRLVPFLDGELTPAEAAEVASHLASCRHCRDEVDQLRRARAALLSLAGSRLPPDFADQVLHRARSAPSGPTLVGLPRLVGLAAGLLLLLGLAGMTGYAVGSGGDRSTPPPSVRPAVDAQAPGGPGLQTYLLVLQEPRGNWPAPERSLQPYVDWHADLQQRGALVASRKLSNDLGRLVVAENGTVEEAPVSSLSYNLSGIFMIRASSYDEAVSLASQSPHLRFGGSVLVRALDPEVPGIDP